MCTFVANTDNVIIFSKAKINIGLHILRKREDGFHDISTFMQLIPFSDIIELIESKPGSGFSMDQSGIMIPGDQESNLCFRAWQLFSNAYKEVSVKIHLHKIIPMGAGLGGGSSNGAAILKGLNSLSGNPLSLEQLYKLAAQLGSDCSIFIKNNSALAEGRGDILQPSPVDVSGLHLILLNSGIEVKTNLAYKNVTPDDSRTELSALLHEPINEWKKLIENDFEKTVFESHPELARLKSELYNSGAIYAAMSGSGASVYGLFRQSPELPAQLKKYLIWSGIV